MDDPESRRRIECYKLRFKLEEKRALERQKQQELAAKK